MVAAVVAGMRLSNPRTWAVLAAVEMDPVRTLRDPLRFVLELLRRRQKMAVRKVALVVAWRMIANLSVARVAAVALAARATRGRQAAVLRVAMVALAKRAISPAKIMCIMPVAAAVGLGMVVEHLEKAVLILAAKAAKGQQVILARMVLALAAAVVASAEGAARAATVS